MELLLGKHIHNVEYCEAPWQKNDRDYGKYYRVVIIAGSINVNEETVKVRFAPAKYKDIVPMANIRFKF